MRYFVCLLASQGQSVPSRVQRKYEAFPRSRGWAFEWTLVGPVAVLTGGDAHEREPLVASMGDGVAVGTVRLDNRPDLERWSEARRAGLSDLELVGQTVHQHGDKYVPWVLGDFAFIVWNASTRVLLGGCDAFAVKKLYHAERDGFIAFASRAEALALEDKYDVQYLAERVAGCDPSPGPPPLQGVGPVPACTIVRLEHEHVSYRRYWSPYDVTSQPVWGRSEREAADTCRTLLAESVRLRLAAGNDTWAQLSGGMDSSSVVSIAQWLAARGAVPHGLAGTVTFVDPHGLGGDERRYSDAVAQRWNICNETVASSSAWCDPPRTDEPTASIEAWARSYRLCERVHAGGGRVLLTGGGGDALFNGTMFFFADWVVSCRLWTAASEMARRAAIGRVSFWELAYRNALLPLLPRPWQRRLLRGKGTVPQWVDRATAKRYELNERATTPLLYGGRVGSKYRDALAANVSTIPSGLSIGIIEENLDVRHPYYYRPLVEFCLRLPPELCVRPYARKWVLREAMVGILPEVVRTRIGKGTYNGTIAWSLAAQREGLGALIRNSILAELGIVDGRELQKAFEAAPYEQDEGQNAFGTVLNALSVEAWLRGRSGRWTHGTHASSLMWTDGLHTSKA
jgi:asparagine synthase (glutamine-hydrolysing)